MGGKIQDRSYPPMTAERLLFSRLGAAALVCGVMLSLAGSGSAWAHPVPRGQHDRTIVVQLTRAGSEKVAFTVQYRLEVDELTVVLDDMRPFSDQVDYARYREKRNEFYNEFTRIYAPILANNLVVKVDGKILGCKPVQRSHTLVDEKQQPLGHLRCDFVFQGEFAVTPGKAVAFSLREGNYELESGKIDVSLTATGDVELKDRLQAEETLKKKEEAQLLPGEEEKLRQVSAQVLLPTATAPTSTPTPVQPDPFPHAKSQAKREQHGPSLLALFRGSEYGVALLLLLSFVIGAVHALTPGHGKALVAAYLIGQQGTVSHAIVLGLVVTLTHTGIVILVAIGLLFADQHTRDWVQAGLGLASGLLIVSLGFWLLLNRLAGRADHIHIGGSHPHHHHHHPHDHTHADHDHDEQGRVIPKPRDRVTWWNLIALGVSGGIVPCWDAVAMLVLAVGMNLLALALPMLLAFSAGLAAVLIALGIAVVKVRSLAQSSWGEGRVIRALPLLSAILIIALGFWLCYENVRG